MDNRIVEMLAELKSMMHSYHLNKWMDMRQVTAYSSLGESSVRRAIDSGRLRVSKKTGKLLFRREWIDRFLMFGRQRLTAKERRELAE